MRLVSTPTAPELEHTSPAAGGTHPEFHTRARPRLAACLAGGKATLPLAAGIVPLMAVYGVAALAAGLPAWLAQGMTLVIFAGAELPGVQLLAAGVPGPLAGLAVALLNARHLLYSAALAPHFWHLGLRWRATPDR